MWRSCPQGRGNHNECSGCGVPALRVGEIIMSVQDVAFLPSRRGIYTTFLTNCGGSESHDHYMS